LDIYKCTSGVHREAILLRYSPSYIYVNDIPKNPQFLFSLLITLIVYMEIKTMEDTSELSSDLYALEDWSKTNLSPLNAGKCKIIR